MVTISGTVQDTNGDPLQGVTVIIVNATTESVAATATTDSNGEYSQSVGADIYHILFSYEDSGEQYQTGSKPNVA